MDDKVRPSTTDIAARLGLDARAPTRKRRPLRLIAIALIVVTLIVYWIARPAPTHYVTATAEMTPLTVLVTATGTLEPTTKVDVGSEISGRIASVAADFNDPVKAGQILAVLDTQELKARAIQSEGTLANARATLVEARLKRKRVAALTKQGHASQEDLDSSTAALDRATAAVTQAEALVDVDRTNLDRAEIKSPIDGVVLDRKIEPGQTVAATFQTPVLFTIAQDLTRMQLHVDVDEADIGQVKGGQGAHFTVDAYPDRSFDAVVASVRYAPRTSEGVVSYEAVLDVANPDLSLRPGMTATAEIIAQKIAPTLTVPNGALRFTPPGFAVKRAEDGTLAAERIRPNVPAPLMPMLPGGQAIMWIADGRTPKPVAVKTGASDGLRTLVTGNGIKEGTKVLVDIERKPAKGGA